MGKNECNDKDFNLAYGGEMVKKQGRARFSSYIYFCTLYLLVKMLLVKLRNLHTSACLNLNYGIATQ